jgi:predicted PurR-regulated permease PerM
MQHSSSESPQVGDGEKSADQDGESPDVQQLPRVQSRPLVVLTVLALAYTLAVAKPLVLPIAIAWLGKVLLAPVVRFTTKLRLPSSVGATLVLTGLVGALGYGGFRFAEPASVWAERLPGELDGIRDRLRSVVSPLESMGKAKDAVENFAADEDKAPPIEVQVVDQSSKGVLLDMLREFGLNASVVLVLLFFLLATEDSFLTKVVELLPRLADKKVAVTSMRAIEHSIARYLQTILLTNTMLGICVGVACWACGLPNPGLWGLLAGLANFVPYIGAIVGASIVASVGLSTFPDLGRALLPALLYLILNSIEGLVFTPIVLGRSLALSPVLLFLWLFFLTSLWGIPGALLAVPLLAAAKIVCDHTPRLVPVGRLFER